jgi:hypothetical protein
MISACFFRHYLGITRLHFEDFFSFIMVLILNLAVEFAMMSAAGNRIGGFALSAAMCCAVRKDCNY